MLNKYQIDCAGCGYSTLVLTKVEDPSPEFCPVCSHPLATPDIAETDQPEGDPS